MDGESEVGMADLKERPGVSGAEEQGVGYGVRLAEEGEGHWLAGLLAAGMSLAVHALFIWAASRVDFGMLARSPYDRPERRFAAVQVEHVDMHGDTRQVLDVLRGMEVTGRDAAAELTEALEALQLPLEAASVEPPPVRMPEAELDLSMLQSAEPPPLEAEWQPRQEILAIETIAVSGEPLPLPRRTIPAIARVPDAPDIAVSVSADRVPLLSDSSRVPVVVPGPVQIASGSLPAPEPSALIQELPAEVTARPAGDRELFEEAPDAVTDVESIERVLQAQVQTFIPPGGRYGYFRLTVERVGPDVLPVRAKDVLLVQDTSSTIAERRLHFSRQAMLDALDQLGPEDRFNVATFVERTTFCFTEWAANTAENRAKAQAFIRAMTAEGNTDFLRSMRDILALETDPERPAVAVLITDGLMHSGVTDSSEIISAFTRENTGRFSIYTIGVADFANTYLLDMLSYSNMGASYYVRSGRWDIPEVILGLLRSVRRPVLSGLRFRCAVDMGVEGFPMQPGNLYLDRPLVLYGRYPAESESLVFQAIGHAGAKRSDMVYSLPLGPGARTQDASIRDGWSLRKIYQLIEVYTQTRDRAHLREMQRLSRSYGQPIPYRGAIGF